MINSLVSMYTKCGNILVANTLFRKMSSRNVVSWNAMIAGYAQNGYDNEALMLFSQMEVENIKPDPVTVVSVLSACAHLGALQKGKWIHEYIRRNGIAIFVFVGASLIATL